MLSDDAVHRVPALTGVGRRYALALGIVGVATLLRLAVDPFIRIYVPLVFNQIPYVVYVAAVVVATWCCGVAAGLLSIVVAAFVGNYLFVAPRYEFIPQSADWFAMGTFAVVAGGLVWVVGTWKRRERLVRELHEQTLAVLEQLPVAVYIADSTGRILSGNPAVERILRQPLLSSRGGERPGGGYYTAFHPDGRPVHDHEHPVVRSLRHGEVVNGEELHIARADGTHAIVHVCSTPLRRAAQRGGGAVVVTLSDVTEEREAAEAVRQRLEELQVILDTVPAAVFVTRDPEARRIDGNATAAQLLRAPAGSNLSKTAPEHERPMTFRAMKDGQEIPGEELPVQVSIRKNVEIRNAEFDVVYDDGTMRTLFGNAAPLRDVNGETRGAVGAFVDVSERRRMEARLREQAEELERASRVKDDFLATLGHELRTPLNAIVGWSSMLLKGGLPAEAIRRAQETIARNAEAQRMLIEDVLDVSRIVSGRLRLEARHTELRHPLDAALESIRPHADEKRVAVRTDFREGPATVQGDAARLQQVFLNLLSNAVKFTPAGGQIEVTLDRVESEVQVEVRDSGIGIATHLLPHVFERFQQADSSSTRKHAGLGLGLAIVRHLVELHGGTVTAHSLGEGRGATFTVHLPFCAFQERRQVNASRPRHVVPVTAVPDETLRLDGLRILVVDDESDARELAASVLRQAGATVEVAASGIDALRRAEAGDPQVLLIDIAMPDMDGYSLIRAIRQADSPAAHSAAIAFTAYAREEDRQRAVTSGFQMHLAKPVQPDALVRAVAAVVQQQKTSRRSA
jgi:signal transduction histidine kinase/ActR/RegA family two-component response regulator